MPGILFAISAMIFWALGDFFTQRTAHRVGKFKTLFFSTLVGSIIVIPLFIFNFHSFNFSSQLFWILPVTACIIVFSALFSLEAFKQGKISIVEPILGFELPLTIALSVIFLGERPSFDQFALMLVVFLGIILAVTKRFPFHSGPAAVEKGVVFAGVSAIGLALSNFMFGITSRIENPLMIFGFVQATLFTIAAVIIHRRKEFANISDNFSDHKSSIIAMGLCNTLGWLSFGYAATNLPISIAITISESYIALAFLLGIVVNKEKLSRHQLIGTLTAIAGVIILASITQ